MITTEIKNVPLQFETDAAVFSPKGIDTGTLAMLSLVSFTKEDYVLDLGCGYGVVGILAGKLIGEEKVILCDISEQAVACARKNALQNGLPELSIRISDGYEAVAEKGFTKILSNPPYHTDFSVAKQFIEEGYKKLAMGGQLVMVTKRLEWYQNKITAVFGGVKVTERDGYYIFCAEKRKRIVKEKVKPVLSKKLQRKYAKKGNAS